MTREIILKYMYLWRWQLIVTIAVLVTLNIALMPLNYDDVYSESIWRIREDSQVINSKKLLDDIRVHKLWGEPTIVKQEIDESEDSTSATYNSMKLIGITLTEKETIAHFVDTESTEVIRVEMGDVLPGYGTVMIIDKEKVTVTSEGEEKVLALYPDKQQWLKSETSEDMSINEKVKANE